MTVYVDDMYTIPMGRFGRMKMSHLIADTREELFACADAIGVPRKWLQKAGKAGEHFDIAMAKRDSAIAWGARPIKMNQLASMVHRREATGSLGSPDDACDWFLALLKSEREARLAALQAEDAE